MVSKVSSWMNDELIQLGDMAQKFWQGEIVPHLYDWDRQKKIDHSVWAKTGAQGLINAYVPEEYGGVGGSICHDAVIFYEQARAGDIAFGIPIHSIATHYISAFGTEEQKHKWLPGLVSGEKVAAIAMTEPSAGTDLQAVKTTAIADGDEYVINGSKTYITNGNSSDIIVLVCKTDPKEGSKGVSLIVVEASDDLPGFARGKPLEKIGGHSQDTSELFFEDVRVPRSNLLGSKEGQGFYQLMQQLPWERLIIGIGAVGYMEFAFNEALKYCQERIIFGKPLIAMQNTRYKLAEVETKLEATRAFVDQCIAKHLKGELSNEEASMIKWWSTDLLSEVVDECLQLHGGAGIMAEYPIGRLYTAVRVQRIYGGANEVMKDLISRRYARL